MTRPLDIALSMIAEGLAPLPVAFMGKAPTDPATGRPLPRWQRLRITAADAPRYFPGEPQNVGVLLGEPSGGLTDIDLDCSEAIRAAAHILPPTRRQGRASAPDSHWFYFAPGAVTRPLHDPCAKVKKRSTLLEIRSTGAQTVVAGSVHSSGEPIAWSNPEDPVARVERADLEARALELGAAALLGRYWAHTGWQGEAGAALYGALQAAGWSDERARRLVRAVLAAAQCEEAGIDPAAAGEMGSWERLCAVLPAEGRRATAVARAWLGLAPEAAQATLPTGSVFATPEDEVPELRVLSPQVRERRAERWLARVPREAHGDGSAQLIRVAATLVRGFALGEGRAYELLRRSPLAAGWTDADLHRRCADAMRGPRTGGAVAWGCKLLREPAAQGPPARGNPPAQLTAERTDVANAERLVRLCGQDLRFVGAWAKGLAWDGKRWTIDDGTRWQHAAVETARTLYAAARSALDEAVGSGDKQPIEKARADLDWAITSHSAARVAAMASLARSQHGVAIGHEQLDADPWLLNVGNGTVDLRTGELRPHRREDLSTKLARVDYEPGARAPVWDAFLHRAMAGDGELVAYLQRLIGYALTGCVREHVLVFFYGGGANGKSTFLGTIHALLGDYATPAPRGLLFRSRGERHPTELATLFGRRFVTCSEIEEGQVFDEALTKDLTGGDPIECRRMREDFWTFEPSHKLFMAGNHKPTVRGNDEGIWRRMRLVPWTVTIPEAERDTALPGKLAAELPGILRWAIEGCLAWQRIGLAAPRAVHDATDGYREENDTLGEFFRRHVVFEPNATIVRRELRQAYEAWCAENGHSPFAARRFAARLRESGVVDGCVRRGAKVLDGWRNVRLMTDFEKEGLVSESAPAAQSSRTFADDVSELLS